jgi:serine phosphatase RsbU (regulator of sigma subunit)
VLHEIHLTDLLDDALLLATELTTNAVVHAGTDIMVQIDADEASVTVTVRDGRRHELPELDTTSGPTLATGGRGLLLVDRIADRWGTIHDENGKSVWFELRHTGNDRRTRATRARSAPRALPVEGTVATVAAPAFAERASSPAQRTASNGADSADLLVRQLLAENERLRHSELRRRASLTFMAEASELLAQSLDIELTAALIPRLVVPRLGDWCAVFRCVDGGDPELASATHADESATTDLVTALDDPSSRHALRSAVHPGERGTLTAVEGIAIPLVVRGRRLGVLAVGRLSQRRHDPDELALIADLARRAALAIDNAALHADRARITDTLQQALLPPTLPEATGMSFAAEYIPTIGAADVGGDFYDVLPLRGGRWLMVIGDVSGKGVAAAAVTGLVRDVIRILARDGRSVPEILERIHETLAERGAGRFATLAVAEVEPADSQLRVTVHLAGHERPILVGAHGTITSVGTFGTVVGLLDTVRTTGVEVAMAPGDTLVFFTDGVTERRRGEELFGIDRTLAALAPLGGHDADIIAARLRAAAIGFSTESPRDDIAILTLRNDAEGAPQ